MKEVVEPKRSELDKSLKERNARRPTLTKKEIALIHEALKHYEAWANKKMAERKQRELKISILERDEVIEHSWLNQKLRDPDF